MPSVIHELLVTLQDATPPIWRRIQVDSATNLRYLHYLLQAAMGWEDSHLYEFRVDRLSYGEQDEDAPSDLMPARDFSLSQVAPRVGESLTYVYDFGDQWTHNILVEGIRLSDESKQYPRCLGGSRACPPEDFGGALTYSLWLRSMESGQDIDLDELEDYPGLDFDPAKFSAAVATRRMRRVATDARRRTWD